MQLLIPSSPDVLHLPLLKLEGTCGRDRAKGLYNHRLHAVAQNFLERVVLLYMARHLEPTNSRPGVGLSFCPTSLHQEGINVLKARLDFLPHV